METPEWTIENITALEDYKLRINFIDGVKKIFDCKPLLEKKIYAPLKDKKFFRRVYLSCGGVAWNDDIDIAPEYLYDAGEII